MDQQRKNLLVFGYGFAIILAFIGFRIWRHHGWGASHAVLGTLIAGLIGVTALKTDALLSIYKPWMKVAGAIGHVMTIVILSVLFYCIFGVVGIILRLLRKDILDRTIDVNRKSYWIKHPVPLDGLNRYTKQY